MLGTAAKVLVLLTMNYFSIIIYNINTHTAHAQL